MQQAPSAPRPATAPQANAAPQATTTPPPFIVSTGMMTSRDLAALNLRASELSNQLSSVTRRRRDVHQQLASAAGADKTGLEQRLAQLDSRIVQIEQDIDENGKQLASIPAARAATTGSGGPFFNSGNGSRGKMEVTPVAIVFTLFVLSPIAMTMSRYLWKRSSASPAAPANPEQMKRLERIEQAVDAIAIEVERVSEGQRFVTRILAEGNQALPVIAAGQKVPAEQRQQI